MKNPKKIFITLLVFAFLFIEIAHCFSQPPPPPNEHGLSSNRSATTTEGAPIGEGMLFLFILAGIYAGKKVYSLRETAVIEK